MNNIYAVLNLTAAELTENYGSALELPEPVGLQQQGSLIGLSAGEREALRRQQMKVQNARLAELKR